MQGNANQNSCFLCGIQARRLVLGGELCVSKMGPLNRPGHAVSLLRDLFFGLLTRKSRYLAFGARIWWFLCEIVAKPGQNLNATGDAGQCKPYSGLRQNARFLLV